MIQAQLKLRPNRKQEAVLIGWLWNLTGVWNWAVRKIALDARIKSTTAQKTSRTYLLTTARRWKFPATHSKASCRRRISPGLVASRRLLRNPGSRA